MSTPQLPICPYCNSKEFLLTESNIWEIFPNDKQNRFDAKLKTCNIDTVTCKQCKTEMNQEFINNTSALADWE